MALNVGKGQFRWDDKTGKSDPDKPLDVYYYRPEVVTEETPVWFIMHGTGRNADDYRDYFINSAREQGALVIAPKFSKSDWEGSTGYNLGNISASNSDLTPVSEQDWSFSKIEPLFDYVVNEVEPTLETDGYYLFGHSAGAQFTHRFLAWKPDARVKLAVAANAGWYTIPQGDNLGYQYDWPYSTSNAPDYNASTANYDPFPINNLDNFLASDLVVLLGEEDTKRTDNLRQTREADGQGRNRFERGQFFYAEGLDEAQTRGVNFDWELKTVPDVGHEGSKMAIPAAELFRLDYLEEQKPDNPPQPTKGKLVWEEQGLVDEAAVVKDSVFELGGGLTATIDWYIKSNGGSFVANGGQDFVSYEQEARGGHTGYLNLGFNNDARDPEDVLGVSIRFNQAVSGLNFTVLDVDSHQKFDDAAEIYIDGRNLLETPDAFTLAGSKVKLDNESYLTGFEGRKNAKKNDPRANIQVNLGSSEVSAIEILFSSTDDGTSYLDPKGQSIGISDLKWTT